MYAQWNVECGMWNVELWNCGIVELWNFTFHISWGSNEYRHIDCRIVDCRESRGREGEGEAENPVEKQKRERLESQQISINQSAVLILLPGYY